MLMVAGAAFLAQGFFAGQARGEDYDIIPSLSVRQEYSDNLFFTSGEKTHSFTTALSPRLELVKKNERTNASLLAGMDWFVYWDTHDVVTAFNQQYRGRLSHRLSERLGVSLGAGYSVNNQPDENITKDGVVINALHRNLQDYSAGIDFALSEKSVAGLSYQYRQEDYPEMPGADNRTHGVSLGYEYDLRAFLPAARGRFNAGFNSYEFDTSRTDNYSATLGLGWSLSETWSVTADVGGRYSVADFDVVSLAPAAQEGTFYPKTIRDSRDSYGLVARAALTVRGETQNGSLTFSRDVGLSSSRNGTSENTSIDVAYRRFLTDKFSSSLTGGYQMSRSDSDDLSAGRIDEDYIRCTAGVRYQFNRNMALDASYSYLKALYNQSETSAERNSVMVSFTIRHPLLDRW